MKAWPKPLCRAAGGDHVGGYPPVCDCWWEDPESIVDGYPMRVCWGVYVVEGVAYTLAGCRVDLVDELFEDGAP